MSEEKSAEQTTTREAESIEERIQTQFNEEKWTRISSKDVSISRFKMLESLMDEANAAGKLDTLRNMAKEQLNEYEPSVGARYFLGMVALKKENPEEIVFLKQLLDQFQENSKWAVVDFLSDKMLEVSENRTILRAKANALEKLGKNKELIPILEKLARIDRKNPDIALKYADAIAGEDMEKAIQFYKLTAEAFAKNQNFEKLKHVWNKLVELIPEDFTFYRKIERILSGHRQKEVLADLFVTLTHHYIKKDDAENIINLSKKILELNPNYSRFKNELLRAYRERYKDHSLLEDFIKYSGLLDSRKNISNSIQNFETNIVFDKDNYVFHRVWGVGKIVTLDTEKMVIDFKEKPAHSMNVQMALKSLKPLQPDHFWVHQYEKPEELKKMFETNFVEFFKLLLKSFGNSMSLSDIKAELADKYLPLSQWSKWWNKKRADLMKDGSIRNSTQRKDMIELHETSVTPSELTMEKFQNNQTFDDRLSIIQEALKDPAENLEALEFSASYFKDMMKSLDFETRLQSMWVLDLLKEAISEDEGLYSAEQKKAIVNHISTMSINDALALNESLKSSDDKRHFAKLIMDNNPEWRKIFVEFLFQTPIKIHKHLLTDLINNGSAEQIQDFFNRLRKEAKENAEVFLWTMKNILSGSLEVQGIPMGEQILSFFRLLRSLPKIEAKGTKLKNAAREIIIGASQDELIKSIEANARESVRKMAALFKDVSFFNDLETEKFIERLVAINKAAFESGDYVSEDSDSADNLIAVLERDGKTAVSKRALEKMQAEMDHLVQVEIPQNSQEIGLAQEKGDLRENAEYKAALEKQSMLQAQVTRLEDDIKKAVRITKDQVNVASIGIGCKVKLKDRSSGDIFVYTIMDQWDADVDKGVISYKSPLGQSMLGKKTGEVVVFGMDNREQKLEVTAIDLAVNGEGILV